MDRTSHIRRIITQGVEALATELGDNPSIETLELALRLAIQAYEPGLPAARMLLERGVSPNILLGGFTETPTLLMWTRGNSTELSLRLLLEFKPDLAVCNSAGNNILHQSAGEGDYRSLINLLSVDPAPALINAKNLSGSSPLDKAILSADRDCVLLLLACGATYDRKRVECLIRALGVSDSERWSPVHEFMDRDEAEKSHSTLDGNTPNTSKSAAKMRL